MAAEITALRSPDLPGETKPRYAGASSAGTTKMMARATQPCRCRIDSVMWPISRTYPVLPGARDRIGGWPSVKAEPRGYAQCRASAARTGRKPDHRKTVDQRVIPGHCYRRSADWSYRCIAHYRM